MLNPRPLGTAAHDTEGRPGGIPATVPAGPSTTAPGGTPGGRVLPTSSRIASINLVRSCSGTSDRSTWCPVDGMVGGLGLSR